jgi:hypothetical protein
MTEYQREQQAFHANRERLKAERLAREGIGIALVLQGGVP